MYTIVPSKRFKRQFKKLLRADEVLAKKILAVVDRLAQGVSLDFRYRDHQLQGKLRLFRECHIEPDWLLVYRLDDTVLILELVATGSHASLFH